MKSCVKCKITKDLSEFYRHPKTTDGFSYACKVCDQYRSKQWRQQNKKQIAENKKQWYSKNKDKVIKYARQYYSDNKQQIIPKIVKYRLNKIKSDPVFKLRKSLCHRLGKLIKQQSSSIALDFLGCSLQELKAHLESQFQPNMTWDNHGKWHIDHIKPLSSFDLTDLAQLRAACHYTNLQPLWAKDNLSKGDRLV
jgi:sulfur relay (sulfurtransferase) DsrC/TusE family protein